jgi:hypothetical protein
MDTELALDKAYDLANNGNLAGARAIYDLMPESSRDELGGYLDRLELLEQVRSQSIHRIALLVDSEDFELAKVEIESHSDQFPSDPDLTRLSSLVKFLEW